MPWAVHLPLTHSKHGDIQTREQQRVRELLVRYYGQKDKAYLPVLEFLDYLTVNSSLINDNCDLRQL